MKKCAQCGMTILFGGVNGPDEKYCNDDCLGQAMQNQALAFVPDEVIYDAISEVHQGHCPMCEERRGPVDVRTSYRVWSFLIVSTHSSALQISCRSCGNKSKVKDILFCGILGWWSISGLLMTPVQIGRNIWGIISTPNRNPSPMLAEVIRGSIAENMSGDSFYELPDQPEVPILGPSAKRPENDT